MLQCIIPAFTYKSAKRSQLALYLSLLNHVASCFSTLSNLVLQVTKQNKIKKNMFYSYHCFVLQIHLGANFIYCQLNSSPICGFLMVTQRKGNKSFVGNLSQQRHFAAQHPDASSSHPSHPLLSLLVHSQCSWLPGGKRMCVRKN